MNGALFCANAPPRKREGALRDAPTPKLQLLIDHTPIVCAAQTCEHTNTRIEYLASEPHHAKEICTDCGRTLRFLPDAQTVERQRFNALRLARLAMCDELTDWEREFVKSVSQREKLSPKQQACLDRLYAEKGTAR